MRSTLSLFEIAYGFFWFIWHIHKIFQPCKFKQYKVAKSTTNVKKIMVIHYQNWLFEINILKFAHGNIFYYMKLQFASRALFNLLLLCGMPKHLAKWAHPYACDKHIPSRIHDGYNASMKFKNDFVTVTNNYGRRYHVSTTKRSCKDNAPIVGTACKAKTSISFSVGSYLMITIVRQHQRQFNYVVHAMQQGKKGRRK